MRVGPQLTRATRRQDELGISERSYPSVNVKTLARDETKSLYDRDFWLPVGSRITDYGAEQNSIHGGQVDGIERNA